MTNTITEITDNLLIEWLTDLGELVEKGEPSSDCPVVVELSALPGSTIQAPIFLAARFVELRDETRALRIEMPVECVSSRMVDITRFRPWALEQTERWTYAHIRIDSLRIDDVRHHSIWVEYHLPESALSRESLAEVVGVLREAHRSTHGRLVFQQKQYRKTLIRESERIMHSRRIFDELDKLVGLRPVKDQVRKLAAMRRVDELRTSAGLKGLNMSPHLVFTGNPGTGKTTVARLIGKLYHSIGLLPTDGVLEVGRSDLVGGFIGQTALKMKGVCMKALGGVLFIDEAYSLEGSGQDFGSEAIETLITFMEANRGKIVIIVAGYPEEMRRFLESNPGLRSRFDRTIEFPDYNDEELLSVFRSMARDHDYVLETGADRELLSWIASLPRGRDFGNARDIRRLFDEVVCNHALWLSGMAEPSRAHLRTITTDIIRASAPARVPTEIIERRSWAGYL